MSLLKINTTARYVLLVLLVLIGLHSILTFTHEPYGRATSVSSISSLWGTQQDLGIPEEYYASPGVPDPTLNGTRKANATLLMLARNSDLESAIRSVRELEDRFNKKYQYPWVFLNEQEFSAEFKKRISNVISGPVSFGLVPQEHWYQPEWIDEEKAEAGRKKMEHDGIIYGGSLPYRNMCRFNSGFFYRHPLLQQFKWYWRVEPDVHFHCDIDFDPFLYMEENDKVYSFTITMYEYSATIETLWESVKQFTKAHPEHVAEDNALNYMSEDGGVTYNLCHFWSNFEIASMDFWRGQAYSEFFDHLDASGGFYYERWGDAPVHSIGAALFARKDQIHFFDNIGYEHAPYTHCPRGTDAWERGKCACNPATNFDHDGYSCMRQWERIQ